MRCVKTYTPHRYSTPRSKRNEYNHMSTKQTQRACTRVALWYGRAIQPDGTRREEPGLPLYPGRAGGAS